VCVCVKSVYADMVDKTTKTADFDEMLSVAGDCNIYQVMTFALVGVMQFVAIDAFAINFIAASMDHWCSVRQLHNLSTDQQRQIAVPPDDRFKSGFSRCYRYDVDWHSISGDNLNSSVSAQDNQSDVAVTKCDEWTYDDTQFTLTIVSQVRSATHLYCFTSSIV